MAFDFVNHLQQLDAPAEDTSKVATETPAAAEATPAAEAPVQKQAGEENAVSSFLKAVDTQMAKTAAIIAAERGEDHGQLFKNCVSACFHYKMAGYTLESREETNEAGETVKVAFDRAEDPNEFVVMCYNMYKDILAQRG